MDVFRMDVIFSLFPHLVSHNQQVPRGLACVIHFLHLGEPSQFIHELSQLRSRHAGASHTLVPI
jgi:hypothetical protein